MAEKKSNKSRAHPKHTVHWEESEEAKQLGNLDAVREARLARAWQEKGDVDARNALVRINLHIARAIAAQYRGYTGIDHEDMIHEGQIGLMEAIDTFKPGEARLSTYASYRVRGRIQAYVMRNWSVVGQWKTNRQQVVFFNLARVKSELGIVEDLTPKQADKVANVLEGQFRSAAGITGDDVLFMEQLRKGDSSLNMQVGGMDGESSSEKLDMLEAKGKNPEETLLHKDGFEPYLEPLQEAVASLNPRMQDIITRHRLAEEDMKLTLKELADVYNLSVERIRQIERSALKKICQFLDVPYDESNLNTYNTKPRKGRGKKKG